jgi:5'-nucleotidase
MRILISNDDGIGAPGIEALIEASKDFGDVVVVAPDRQRSASSHGISIHQGLYVEEIATAHENVQAFSVTGTPVDCVKWAIVKLGTDTPFDLMLSGINEGANLAADVLYSGTLAAAGEAALQGVPSIAFSLVGPPFPFEDAAQVAKRIIIHVSELTIPHDTFLNVNFPSHHLKTASFEATVLGARGYLDRFVEKVDEKNRTYYEYAGEELMETTGSHSDVAAIRRNNVSITPVRYQFTHDKMVEPLRQWLQNELQSQSTVFIKE